MAAIKLQHADLAEHQGSLAQHLREQWMKGDLCDVVLKSSDGTEHRAHANVLSAASKFFNRLLVGSFLEADQRKRGEPMQVAASANVVSVLLDYIYGGQPELPVSDSIELLRLADAYDCPTLAAAVETGLRSSLDKPQPDVAVALTVLLQTQGLHDLKAGCEAAVATNFVACVEHPSFLKLDACQLGRIVERVDVNVPHEEEVLKGIFKWFNHSPTDRVANLGLLLRHVDFQSMARGNLARISHFASSMGPGGDCLQREVDDALQARKKRKATATKTRDGFRPKRRCFKHWSPELGAISDGSGRKVRSECSRVLWWHEGTIYGTDGIEASSVFCWKPGETDARTVAGKGARVAGVNDIKDCRGLCASKDGTVFLADRTKRLVSFQNGVGQVVLGDVEGLWDVFCSPNGIVYVLSQGGEAVQKLVGTMLQPVILSEHLPEEMRFKAFRFFVTSEEVIYLNDLRRGRVLRISPGETQPVVVFKIPQPSTPLGLFVTEGKTIYVGDLMQKKVWAFHSCDSTCAEVLTCPHGLSPFSILVKDQSLFLALRDLRDPYSNHPRNGIYEYTLPPELQLE